MMRVLVTGHNGYIGSALVPELLAAGHEVVGLDTYLFEAGRFGPSEPDIPSLRLDLRDVRAEHVEGFDAVVHLAALCNDPLGNLNPDLTYEINYHASVRLARAARAAGVSRWLFASSCSMYGVAMEGLLTEEAPFNPVTPYARSKVLTEREVRALATPDFSPTFLRNATAYGLSPRLRLDVVVNNLVAHAVTTGQMLLQSDGTPWRPLVHVEDIAQAFAAVLQAPREAVHNRAFNVGRNEDNLRIHEVVGLIQAAVPGCAIRFAEGAGPDPRCYRVECSAIARALPAFKPRWRVRDGIEQLVEAFRRAPLAREDLLGGRYTRVDQIRNLQSAERLDGDLRWLTHPANSVRG